ncbi:hypothetical protein [Pseudomonas sp. Gutcm_11s]|uniref:hypothetical protein n=1 Tax=Pseudomonas sp. Gutcm_11s TaxID=3026088 RepID=UPI00235E4EF3|nr:hypothetical protein [Pseudomonas sp. Gutcm_11s]MDD0842203.1 hypothetical protein [Pseudomonas sp. Gutcm_11s]
MKHRLGSSREGYLYSLAKQWYGQGRRLYHLSKRAIIKACLLLLSRHRKRKLLSSADPVKEVNVWLGQKDHVPVYCYRFFDREIDSASVVGQLLLRECNSVVCEEMRSYLFIRSCLAQDFRSLTREDVSGAINGICVYAGPEQQLRKLKGLLVGLVVRRYSAAELLWVLESAGIRGRDISEHLKLKVLARIAQDSREDLFLKWRDMFSTELSAAALVKLGMYERQLSGQGGFLELERTFCALPFYISRYYSDTFKPTFDCLPSARNYIDARYAPSRQEEIRSYILDKIRSREACAYIRLGDGECYGFGCDGEFVTEEGLLRQELHWWGSALDNALRAELVLRFRDSIEVASILGVPTVSRLIRDFNLIKADAYPMNSVMCRILAVMKGGAPLLRSRLVVEDQSNLFIFNAEFLGRICEQADKVVVVSGLCSTRLARYFSCAKFSFIDIPTHRLLRGEGFASSQEDILPFVYRRYEQEIIALARPGVVFLVSAGFIGKTFIAEAAKKGAVALDVGQYLVSCVSGSEVES